MRKINPLTRRGSGLLCAMLINTNNKTAPIIFNLLLLIHYPFLRKKRVYVFRFWLYNVFYATRNHL